MGPAAYPLTPVSDTPSHVTQSSGTRPSGPSLTPGLHEVPLLALDKSGMSVEASPIYANHNVPDAAAAAGAIS